MLMTSFAGDRYLAGVSAFRPSDGLVDCDVRILMPPFRELAHSPTLTCIGPCALGPLWGYP